MIFVKRPLLVNVIPVIVLRVSNVTFMGIVMKALA